MRSSRNKAPRADERGITLVEVMISVAIIVIGMLGLMQVASVSVAANSRVASAEVPPKSRFSSTSDRRSSSPVRKRSPARATEFMDTPAIIPAKLMA